MFTSYKNNLKKTWKTIDEALKKRCNTGKFPTEFIINNKSITDHKEIANQFNIFFSNIGSNLSASIELEIEPHWHSLIILMIQLNVVLISVKSLKTKSS